MAQDAECAVRKSERSGDGSPIAMRLIKGKQLLSVYLAFELFLALLVNKQAVNEVFLAVKPDGSAFIKMSGDCLQTVQSVHLGDTDAGCLRMNANRGAAIRNPGNVSSESLDHRWTAEQRQCPAMITKAPTAIAIQDAAPIVREQVSRAIPGRTGERLARPDAKRSQVRNHFLRGNLYAVVANSFPVKREIGIKQRQDFYKMIFIALSKIDIDLAVINSCISGEKSQQIGLRLARQGLSKEVFIEDIVPRSQVRCRTAIDPATFQDTLNRTKRYTIACRNFAERHPAEIIKDNLLFLTLRENVIEFWHRHCLLLEC